MPWPIRHTNEYRADSVSPSTMVLVRTVLALMVAGTVAMAVAVLLVQDQLTRPWLAMILLAVVTSFTAAASIAVRWRPELLFHPGAVAAELMVGGMVLAADGWALLDERTFDPPALGVIWPLAGVVSAGIVAGPRWGVVAGTAVAVARLGGAVATDPRDFVFSTGADRIIGIDQPRVLPIVSLAVLYATVGAGAGYVARLQQRAETEIESARAREAVAATLHDGVLQTLAIIQRRSTDPDLVRLARRTDTDLRHFLDTGQDHPTSGDGLVGQIRSVCADHATRFDGAVRVVVDDPPDCDAVTADALTRACGEALTNSGKHAGADAVTVYVGADLYEPRQVLVTVNDDGVGFDPTTVTPGRGLDMSVRRRVQEAGGRVEIRSSPGEGTEVRLWGP